MTKTYRQTDRWTDTTGQSLQRLAAHLAHFLPYEEVVFQKGDLFATSLYQDSPASLGLGNRNQEKSIFSYFPISLSVREVHTYPVTH